MAACEAWVWASRWHSLSGTLLRVHPLGWPTLTALGASQNRCDPQRVAVLNTFLSARSDLARICPSSV